MNDQTSPAGRSALVVDDDHLVRDVTVCLVEDLGFTTFCEASGERALDLLMRDPTIELLVTDFRMPGMSGAELIQRALSERPGLCAMLASAYTDEVPQLPEGVVVLRKPYGKLELIEAIGTCLKSGKLARGETDVPHGVEPASSPV